MRVIRHPIIELPKKKRVKFLLNGCEVEGCEGEPIAIALLDQGIKVFSRSPKYGRARGFFCAIGNCASCLMRVDGIPNVRTCIKELEAGMKVETQTGRGYLVAKD